MNLIYFFFIISLGQCLRKEERIEGTIIVSSKWNEEIKQLLQTSSFEIGIQNNEQCIQELKNIKKYLSTQNETLISFQEIKEEPLNTIINQNKGIKEIIERFTSNVTFSSLKQLIFSQKRFKEKAELQQFYLFLIQSILPREDIIKYLSPFIQYFKEITFLCKDIYCSLSNKKNNHFVIANEEIILFLQLLLEKEQLEFPTPTTYLEFIITKRENISFIKVKMNNSLILIGPNHQRSYELTYFLQLIE
ncbi:hypothetical protein EHI8A_028760 [Entamoeba histolytica HM-1:IMSS-B]|uniref:Uncharacterized protein n=6 Tax=Entamoeba histolytica TaxID=5759 RepID=C4M102_ENTH1|nr:hypothetical protein EHI_135160 [Entamoeba histolytica HM-1:IMSS]EMD44957.1 Hypothetical protein EHI5A_055400 [Entamoeba histolytica KU27]EMH72406.1 hypothetical protein EHI8A_028760 [Entamoeba histolytica HM-1:IMSS-B]EMS14991.1 hypothetical protein KM1_066540 [Entamoeba histolytica HM-3:IMSS]ENY63071.1 hypothetical protein EHI7A_030760 [Entamoeba histolytica HM-1:IMSS-A]GAT94862.1 hypothetical protein CL6EHI_135160 [Entamoeba histolytica]|eukprot:XP_649752.1 hypothetical protein EHI_135160 [Entamoeba histolytica HM-1:IMSS]